MAWLDVCTPWLFVLVYSFVDGELMNVLLCSSDFMTASHWDVTVMFIESVNNVASCLAHG